MMNEDVLEEFKYKIRDLEDEIRKLKKENSELVNQMGNLQYSINSVKGDIADANSEIMCLVDDVVDLRDKFEEIE